MKRAAKRWELWSCDEATGEMTYVGSYASRGGAAGMAKRRGPGWYITPAVPEAVAAAA